MNRSLRRAAGYTLVEILVVIFIIALFTGAALLSFGLVSQDTRLEDQARRLTTLVELASDEAIIQGRDYGLRVEPQGYRFYVFDNFLEQWLTLDDDTLFRGRSLDEDLEFALIIEGRDIVLEERKRRTMPVSTTDPENPQIIEEDQPQIMLMSNGGVTPFELRLERRFEDETFTLIGEANGTLRLETDEPTI